MSKNAVSRRQGLAMLLAMAAAAPPPARAAGAPLRVALAPFLSPAALLAAFRPLREHLERVLQRPVEMATAKDFRALVEAARRGDHDVVQLPAHLARLAMTDWRFEFVAAPVEQVAVVVVAKAGGPVRSAGDLKGRRIGMLDALSLTATVGRRWLEDQGLAADVSVQTIPSVNSGLFALDRGDVAAVVASESQLVILPPSTPRGEVVLATIGDIPGPMFVAHPALPAADLAALRAAAASFVHDASRPITAANAPLRVIEPARLARLDPLGRHRPPGPGRGPLSAVTRMTLAVVLLLAALLGGGWAWTPDRDRAELEAQYAGAGSEFATVDGLRLHLRDSAPGAAPGTPTLILLHGFGASLHTWEPWAQALAPQWRVIRLDLPGAGLTGADPGNDYTDARTLRLLLALMDQRGVARASFVGHSMGGRLAWRMAAEHPGRVDKLVLLAPDGFASPGFEYGKPPDVGLSVQLMRWMLPRRVLRMGLEPAYADPQRLDEATVTRYHDMLLAPGVRGALIARMQQLVLQDPAPLLRRIQAPTLLLWGEADQMIPAKHAQDYLQLMPQARAVVLPGLGHVPHEEAPQQSLPPVRAFLGE